MKYNTIQFLIHKEKDPIKISNLLNDLIDILIKKLDHPQNEESYKK